MAPVGWHCTLKRMFHVERGGSSMNPSFLLLFSPPDRKGLLDLCWNPRLRCFYTTPPPRIPPEQLSSGSRQVSRQSSSPVDPAECPARAARLRGQGSSPVDPAEYPARAARQWIPPSIPPELLSSGSRPVSRRAARQWIPPSIPPERLASGSRRVSR